MRWILSLISKGLGNQIILSNINYFETIWSFDTANLDRYRRIYGEGDGFREIKDDTYIRTGRITWS